MKFLRSKSKAASDEVTVDSQQLDIRRTNSEALPGVDEGQEGGEDAASAAVEEENPLQNGVEGAVADIEAKGIEGGEQPLDGADGAPTLPEGAVGGDVEEGQAVVPSFSNGTEDDSLPPPPPPPGLPEHMMMSKPSDARDSSYSADPNKGDGRGNRKKVAAFAGVVAIAAIALGLGFGLGSGDDESAENDANPTSGSEGDDVNVTDATAAATYAPSPAGTLWTDDEFVEDLVMSTSTTEATTAAAPVDETYDAIIIGAGWAGLRAAETLLDTTDSVLVLEAANYIGGRTKSTPDGTNDLGAEWLYPIGGSMESTLSNGGYIDSVPTETDTMSPLSEENGVIYQQTRDDATGETTTVELEDSAGWYDEMWGGFLQFRTNRLEEIRGGSYADAIDEYINRWNWNDDEALQFLNLMEDSTEIEHAGDSSQLNVEEVEYGRSSVESYYMNVPGVGFGNTAAEYATPFADKIKLNARVTEINSEEEGGGDGTGEEGAINVAYVEGGVTKAAKAKTVLVTAPLGVLKAGSINFVPSLPANKQASIDNMGYGLINKCILTWNDPDALVWPEDKLWFLLVTPTDETSGEWTTFFNGSKFKGYPTLTAWVGGSEAADAETRSDDQIANKVMNNLIAMFPTIGAPDDIIITRWGSDENVLGAHSFPVAGRDFADDASNLQQNVGNVYFAGEATSSSDWATTTGAWDTGEEAALAMAQQLTAGV